VPDAYDSAAQNITEHQRAMLSAMAQGGRAGLDAYNAGQAELQAQKERAVQAALAEAAATAGPYADTSRMVNTVQDPYNRWQADMTANQAHRTASMAQLQAMYDSYFNQAQAAIPALRTYSQAEAAKRQAAEALEQRRMSLAERELDMREQEMSGGGSIIKALNEQYGGVAGGNRALLAEARNYVNSRGGQFGRAGTTKLLEEFDRELGLPPGYTKSLLPPRRAASGGSQGERRDARSRAVLDQATKRYGAGSKTVKALTLLLANNDSLASALQDLEDGLAATAAGETDVFRTPSGKGYLSRRALQALLRQAYA